VCHNPQVRVDQLDDYVWQSVCELLQHPERMLAEWSRRKDHDGVPAQVRAHRDDAARALAVQERSLKRLVDAYEAGAIELNELKVRSETVRARVDRARRDLAEAEQKLHETVHLRSVITQLDAFAARVRRGLDRLSWSERQHIIRTLVAQVDIDENGATVVYRLPPASSTPSGGVPGGDGSKSCQLRERRAFSVAQQYPARRAG
jgi:site-specific DNA recombinase